MRKKILIVVMFIGLFVISPFSAKTTSELTKEQAKVKSDIDSANDKIMDYEEEITSLNEKIEENNSKIKDLEKDLEENKAAVKEAQPGVNSTLVMMQKMNNSNMLATYFYDENTLGNNYFLKLDNINTMFSSVAGDVGEFVVRIEDAQADIDDINKIKDENKKKLDESNEKLSEQEELETSLKEQLVDIEAEIGEVVSTTTSASVGGSKEAIMAAAGISSSDYTYVDYIITKESGWNATAANPMSSAYGLCQALPGSKMASAGSDWQTNAVTQMKWCTGYATSRYGSWAGAYNFWIGHNWW